MRCWQLKKTDAQRRADGEVSRLRASLDREILANKSMCSRVEHLETEGRGRREAEREVCRLREETGACSAESLVFVLASACKY